MYLPTRSGDHVQVEARIFRSAARTLRAVRIKHDLRNVHKADELLQEYSHQDNDVTRHSKMWNTERASKPMASMIFVSWVPELHNLARNATNRQTGCICPRATVITLR